MHLLNNVRAATLVPLPKLSVQGGKKKCSCWNVNISIRVFAHVNLSSYCSLSDPFSLLNCRARLHFCVLNTTVIFPPPEKLQHASKPDTVNNKKKPTAAVDLPLPFLAWTDSGDLIPVVSAMEPSEAWVGPRRNTPERRLVWRRIRLLLGCLTATASVDLLVDRLPADRDDLVNRADEWG